MDNIYTTTPTRKDDRMSHQMAPHVPTTLIGRIDEPQPVLRARLPTARLTRSDAVRDLVETALRLYDAKWADQARERELAAVANRTTSTQG